MHQERIDSNTKVADRCGIGTINPVIGYSNSDHNQMPFLNGEGEVV